MKAFSSLLLSFVIAVACFTLALSQDHMSDHITGPPSTTDATVAIGDGAQRQSRGAAVGDFSWQGRVAPGGTVEVKGISGHIRAEVVAGDLVEIIAAKRGSGDADQVKIQVAEYDGGVALCTEYPAVDPAHPFRCSASKMGEQIATSTDMSGGRARIEFEGGGGGEMQLLDVWVDYTVRLPVGVGLIAFTVDGDVSVTTPSSHVTAESVLGNVTISLAESPGAEVRAKSAVGSVESDWRLSFKKGAIVGQKATGTIGRGGPKLYLCSATGNILLRRAE